MRGNNGILMFLLKVETLRSVVAGVIWGQKSWNRYQSTDCVVAVIVYDIILSSSNEE